MPMTKATIKRDLGAPHRQGEVVTTDLVLPEGVRHRPSDHRHRTMARGRGWDVPSLTKDSVEE